MLKEWLGDSINAKALTAHPTSPESIGTTNAIGADNLDSSVQVFPILIRKIHEALLEADVTVDEWMTACNLLVGAGKVATEQRNEVVLVIDIFGIESLVEKA